MILPILRQVFERNRKMKRIISTLLICILLVGCAFTLFSCGDPETDPAVAKADLEEEGYKVVLTEYKDTAGLKATIYASKQDLIERTDDYVEIYYFVDEASAQKAWDACSESYMAQVEASKGYDHEIEAGLAGTVIYKGTLDAVDIIK